ncbi:hypothetical protein DNTS_032843 [Danionella cerebrum]|uniref:Uncharacterized protein n=1 Tax=Danionella cerebrum TaxID=2873325 RepID=A0A553PUP6_9TELE|nr:hypothetical protein DNTS_032843 [Danionella translucida]TRY81413.1 hypothetical protein DNTS_032843 [Danionella translucida]TRY81414.1 hypothetical protein DNTS_032843 [Danionella translucida]
MSTDDKALPWGAMSPKHWKKFPPVSPPQQQAPADAHVYDCVAAEPKYAKVNKKRQNEEDGLHYAEVQVLQSEREKPRQATSSHTTEYATINFNSPSKASQPLQTSAKAADLFIPPGELQRPRLSKKKSVCSNQEVTG